MAFDIVVEIKEEKMSRPIDMVTLDTYTNTDTLDRIEEVKLVGVWLTTFLDWEKNKREIPR